MDLRRFLNGDVKNIKDDLKGKMTAASEDPQFERLSEYRDQINYIEQTVEITKYHVYNTMTVDVFAFTLTKVGFQPSISVTQFSIIKRDSALFFQCILTPEEELTSHIVHSTQEANHTEA